MSVADAKNLPDQELFEKRLAQEQINIHKQSLSELDLIELDKETLTAYGKEIANKQVK